MEYVCIVCLGLFSMSAPGLSKEMYFSGGSIFQVVLGRDELAGYPRPPTLPKAMAKLQTISIRRSSREEGLRRLDPLQPRLATAKPIPYLNPKL